MRHTLTPLSALLMALSAMSCTAGPRALVVGEDACRYCRMTIDDVRYGAMVVTATGRVETFDAIECLASFVAALPPESPPRGIYVADFDAPSHWVMARDARFLYRSQLRSPMGRELAAFDPTVSTAALRARHGGEIIAWTDVLALVQRAPFTPEGAAPMGAPEADSAHALHGAAAPHPH
jgi:copper chaperone NosL